MLEAVNNVIGLKVHVLNMHQVISALVAFVFNTSRKDTLQRIEHEKSQLQHERDQANLEIEKVRKAIEE